MVVVTEPNVCMSDSLVTTERSAHHACLQKVDAAADIVKLQRSKLHIGGTKRKQCDDVMDDPNTAHRDSRHLSFSQMIEISELNFIYCV